MAGTPPGDELATRLRDAAAATAEAKRSVLGGAVDADLDAEALEQAVRAAEAALRRRALG